MSEIKSPRRVRLERAYFLTFLEAANGGFRELAENEFRISTAGECSHKLFYQKFHGVEAPISEMETPKDRFTGVIEIPGGKAASGTLLHESIQRRIMIIGGTPVKAVEVEIKETIDGVFYSGHVDVSYEDNVKDGMIVNDIKTVSNEPPSFTFDQLTGKKNMKAGGYPALKKEEAEYQVNTYAYIMKAAGFTITWIEKVGLSYKLDFYATRESKFKEVHEKFKDVLECVKKSKETGTMILPKVAGVQMCTYCEYKGTRCKGNLEAGQSTLKIEKRSLVGFD